MNNFNKFKFLCLSLALASCSNPGDTPLVEAGGRDLNRVGPTVYGASLALTLEGDIAETSNVYNLNLHFENQTLSVTGEVKDGKATLKDLPADELLSIDGELFEGKMQLRYKSHHCEKELATPTPLSTDEPLSLSLDCYPLESIARHGRASLNLPAGQVETNFIEMDQNAVIEKSKELHPAGSELILTNNIDGSGVASLNFTSKLVTLNLGGDLFFRGDLSTLPSVQSNKLSIDISPFHALMDGMPIALDLVYGNKAHLTEARQVTLIREGLAYMFKPEDTPLVAIKIKLTDENGDVLFEGLMKEEHGAKEFSVVSYNVENLFDQNEDDYNSGYGDYRGTPNDRGHYGNYYVPVWFEEAMRSFTDVKAMGIKKVLTSIDPLGPEIVALQEIENDSALGALRDQMAGLGYEMIFSGTPEGVEPYPVGMALLTRFPVISKDLVVVEPPEGLDERGQRSLRPILKVKVAIGDHSLVIYSNHWKSKGGPESLRVASAKSLKKDIDAMLAENPKQDFVLVGDFNSLHNENVEIEDRHNDTNGITGINDILGAQGDELKLVKRGGGPEFYNMAYELPRAQRKSAWHHGFGWSNFDQMIVNKNVYDQEGITYFDNTFMVARADWPAFSYLFNEDGTTNRWNSERLGPYTEHSVGGYSDHLPIFAKYRVMGQQSYRTIRLNNPGRPDHTDF